jgi:hypothetical protein
MTTQADGSCPSWIPPGHARRHERTDELDIHWMQSCERGWTFYATVRSLRIAHRTPRLPSRQGPRRRTSAGS